MGDQPQFTISGKELILDVDSSDLEVFRWNAPKRVPVFFVFVDEKIHIITLDEDEKPFAFVKTNTQRKPVKLVTDEEVLMYSEEAAKLLKETEPADV